MDPATGATDIQFAQRLADAADTITLGLFGSPGLATHTKRDSSHVSDADLRVDHELRRLIGEHHPNDSIMSEEIAPIVAGARRWIIDPIDATANYIRGNPVFATLIALESSGVIEIGVVSAPALGRRWWAVRGEGAFVNGEAMTVSAINDLAECQISHDSDVEFELHRDGTRFRDLARRCWRTRGFGDFWSHMLVAEGAVDIALEPAVYPWDVAPLKVIVEEAGGTITGINGGHVMVAGDVISSNGLVHDEVVRIMSAADEQPWI